MVVKVLCFYFHRSCHCCQIQGLSFGLPIHDLLHSLPVFYRWQEVMRKIEMFVDVQELNHQGEYVPVEVQPRPDVPSAGVFQLQQV